MADEGTETVDEASGASLEEAIERHRRGDVGGAWPVYERVLAADPENVTALHFGGLLAYGQGEKPLGIAMIERALGHEPDYVDAANNLGNLLKLEGRLEEAETRYRRALRSAPDAVDPMINLGVLARARQADEEAERWYRRAIERAPDNPLPWLNLSGLFDRQGRAAEALEAIQTAIERTAGDDPEHRPLHYRRAHILTRLGRLDEVRAIHERLLASDPDDRTARHMLAALTGENVPEKPDEDYVRGLFDRFSESFDEVLDNLDYRAPELVGGVVERCCAGLGRTLRVLDAGCGTGLCGRFLRPFADTLTGVDLSPGMLARARHVDRYDALVEADLVDFLAAADTPYDLVVSADTICYFGALDALFAATRGALARGGRFVFTVEHDDGAPAATGYVLQTHGRYAHSRPGVARALERAGLTLHAADEVTLRKERGEPVRGLLVHATVDPVRD